MLWVILSLSSALLIAFVDIISKSVFSKFKFRPVQINFGRSFFIIFLSLLFFASKMEFKLSGLLYLLLIVKVFFMVSFDMLYLSLLEKHDVSKIAPLNNLSPVMLIVLTSVFLQESITLLNLLGIFIIIFSTYYLEVIIGHHSSKKPLKSHSVHFKKFDPKFAATVLLMLLVVSLCAMSDRIILRTVSVYTNIFFTYALSALALLFFLARSKLVKKTFTMLSRNPIFLIQSAFNLFSSVFILQALAMPEATTSLIIPLRRTSTLMAAFIGGFLFHEKHMKEKLFAVGFMLIGILLIAL